MVERDDRNRRYRCQTRQSAFQAECQGQHACRKPDGRLDRYRPIGGGEVVEVPFATTRETGGDDCHEGPRGPEQDIKDEMDERGLHTVSLGDNSVRADKEKDSVNRQRDNCG